MLDDPENDLYFHFLLPVVSEFEKVNAFFQATGLDASVMLKELSTHYSSLKGRVENSSGAPMEADKVDYGAKFLWKAAALKRKSKTMQKLSEESMMFTPDTTVLKQFGRVSLNDLPMQHLIEKSMTEINCQYRNARHVNWKEATVFEGEILPTDAATSSGWHPKLQKPSWQPYVSRTRNLCPCVLDNAEKQCCS